MTQMLTARCRSLDRRGLSRVTVPMMNGFSDCRVAVIVLPEVKTIPFACSPAWISLGYNALFNCSW